MTRHLSAVPDRDDPEVYGWVEFLADSTKPPQRLTVAVDYGDGDPGTDVVLSPSGTVLKHPYDYAPRKSTEEERAAVGWTW